MEKKQLEAAAQEALFILDDLQVRGSEAHKVVRLKQLVAGIAGELISSKPEPEKQKQEASGG